MGPAAPGILNELKDAVASRTALLVVGVLLIQSAFIVSFVGALHQPAPHRIPVDLVAPAFTARLVSELNGLPSHPLEVTAVPAAQARADTLDGAADGAFLVHLTTNTDHLLVASGGGAGVAAALQSIFERVETKVHRQLTTRDLVPAQPGDSRALTGYYLVIGWIVGGYLAAAILGVAKGARPATKRRALIRLLSMLPYALASGVAGALIVGPLFGALTGHFWVLCLLGILLVLSSATVTMAFQTLFGVVGIGLTILLFVVLGNPSAGGASQWSLLPAFWGGLGPALPNGAGTDAVRQAVYFSSHGLLGNVGVIALYVVVGALLTLGASALHERRAGSTPAEQRLIALGQLGYRA